MERIVVVRQQQENTFLDVVAFFDKNQKNATGGLQLGIRDLKYVTCYQRTTFLCPARPIFILYLNRK